MKQYPDDTLLGDDVEIRKEPKNSRQIIVSPKAISGETSGIPVWAIVAGLVVILFHKDIKRLLEKI